MPQCLVRMLRQMRRMFVENVDEPIDATASAVEESDPDSDYNSAFR